MITATAPFPVTFSIHFRPHGPSFTETAKAIINDLRTMSTQTKARLEFLALAVTLILTVGSAFKVFILLPPRVEALEEKSKQAEEKMDTLQGKASATDVAIAGIIPQLTAIQLGISDIKSEIRDIRSAQNNTNLANTQPPR